MSESLIGHKAFSLEGGTNEIGYQPFELRNPHYPIGVWDGTNIRYVPLIVHTGDYGYGEGPYGEGSYGGA